MAAEPPPSFQLLKKALELEKLRELRKKIKFDKHFPMDIVQFLTKYWVRQKEIAERNVNMKLENKKGDEKEKALRG
jgi:hypothetical protein